MSTVQNGQIVTDGLVLCLDAANPKSYVSGSLVWNDLTSYGNSGSLVNGPTFNSANGGSLVFDGVNDYIQIDDNNISGSLEITLETIAKINSNTSVSINGGNSQYIFFKQNSRTNEFESFCHAYMPSGPIMGAFLAACSSATGAQVISSGSYDVYINNIIVITSTYTSSVLRLYINGKLIDQKATGFSLNYNMVNKCTIGRANAIGNTYDRLLNGDVYNVKVYNRALSSQEILQNYNALKSRFGLT